MPWLAVFNEVDWEPSYLRKDPLRKMCSSSCKGRGGWRGRVVEQWARNMPSLIGAE